MNQAGPLAGRRIVLTRAREQSRELKEKLEGLGAEVVVLPVIEIAAPESYASLDAAVLKLREYAWLVLTSANGARVLGERLALLGLDAAAFAQVQVAAVGAATAGVLRELGFVVALTPEQYVAEALVGALQERTRGQRVLLLRAQVARDVLPDELRRAGAVVDVVEAYQTVVPAGAAADLALLIEAEQALDAVVFASSSALKHFLALLDPAQQEEARKVRAVSIGPVTSASLREAKWAPAIEARVATAAGLAEACMRLFSRSIPPVP